MCVFTTFVNSVRKDWAIAFYSEVKREGKFFCRVYMFYPKLYFQSMYRFLNTNCDQVII